MSVRIEDQALQEYEELSSIASHSGHVLEAFSHQNPDGDDPTRSSAEFSGLSKCRGKTATGLVISQGWSVIRHS